MPKSIPNYKGKLEYWYGEKEKRDRKLDIKYIRNKFPYAKIIELKIKGMQHGWLYLKKW